MLQQFWYLPSHPSNKLFHFYSLQLFYKMYTSNLTCTLPQLYGLWASIIWHLLMVIDLHKEKIFFNHLSASVVLQPFPSIFLCLENTAEERLQVNANSGVHPCPWLICHAWNKGRLNAMANLCPPAPDCPVHRPHWACSASKLWDDSMACFLPGIM